MATHDYVLANAAGAAFRSDLNNALAAIVSQNSSATEPTTTYAYMPWFDTTNGILKFRNASNTGWVIDDLNSARGSVTMHATTMDIWAEPKIVDGTGSAVTITDIADAPQAGAVRILYPITGTTITDNATFDVDGGANYTTEAGDALIFEAVTTSTFKVHIIKADGTAVVADTSAQIQPISASVGSNALTISASALSLDFRSTTLGSGTVTRVSGTPSNLVISSGSTLGTVSGVPSDIAVLAINNAGTIELAAVNLGSAMNLSETGVISTTAEGGAGGADSATVVYSTTARTNVAYRVIGIIRSTQATAGTWATAPSLIQGVGGQYLPTKLGGTNIVNGGFVASTSGTSKEWTNIPPWAKRITVQLANVSLDASTDLLIQIGIGSYKTTGYESSSCVTGVATTTSTAGFNIYATSASKLSGTIVIERFSNTAIWISSHALSNYASNSPTGGGYQADVGGAGPIDRVKVFSVSGTANFDSGYINVNWE